jgi:cytochrome P450
MAILNPRVPGKTGTSRLSTPPGPRNLHPIRSALAFQRDPLIFLTRQVKDYGDISQFHLLHLPIIVINHPEYVKHVLQDNNANYDKDVFLFKTVRPLFGNGLVTAVGGEDWLRQRRLIQPVFHRQRIAAFGSLMTQAAEEMLERWHGRVDQAAPLDLSEEVSHILLQVVCKALLNIDSSTEQARVFSGAFIEGSRILANFARLPFPPLTFPTARNRRFWAEIHKMDEIVYALIQQRRESKEDAGDLLTMLMQAVDEETGEGMSDRQLRDELITIMVAGHETGSNGLSWTCYLLAQHPEIEQRLYAEVDQVLGGRVPTIDDLPRLTYTRMVLDEALRYYSPAWQLMRRARQEDQMGGYRIPANATIFWSTYVLHRHPDFWEKPEEFYPEHFLPEQVAQRPRNAYVPFSNGPRICIGQSFAMTEMMLILATIIQKYRLELVPEHVVTLEPLLTLRPAKGLLMRAYPR